MSIEPMKRGTLRNGNQAIDPRLLPTVSPRCGARGRRSGLPCRCPDIRRKDGTYGRCQFHGGKSTGARTEEGKERIRAAVTKHGRETNAARAARKQLRDQLKNLRAQSERIHSKP